MGLICGQWTFADPVDRERPARLPFAGIADAASSSSTIFCDEAFCLLARGFSVVKLHGLSRRPANVESNSFLVWDGRLDNASDVARDLGTPFNAKSEDAEIVAAAYEKWNTDAFRRFKGDWALTIWKVQEQRLILAKDPIGTHPLFFSLTPRGLIWGSSLAWIVQNSAASLSLNFEYLAGWLAFFPSAALTPYSGIEAVPAACFVSFETGRAVIRKYWDFEPREANRRRNESEYEEQFRSVFTNSVRRRLRSTKPVLAELSGGMDSSSIVCVADALLTREPGLTPKLDTLSYYDDQEPDWNEKPYFALVEAQRGRKGMHVPADSSQYMAALFEDQELAAIPAEQGKNPAREDAVTAFIRSQGYGSVLSGIAGDEFTGGVPTPIPELADLLAAGRVGPLAKQLMRWALSQRRPWTHVFLETARSFAPPYFGGTTITRRPPTWLTPQFQRQFRSALDGYDKPLRLWGPQPSFQENLSALETLRRQLAVSTSGSETTIEKRYPYLDSDFLQFLFTVPRQQLVQPGRRRSLMRRSLAGIVPDEILNRKRKAYVTRAPRAAIATHWKNIQSLTHDMIAESLGIISSAAYRQSLEDVRSGKEMAIVPIQRMLSLESWLRNLSRWGVLHKSIALESEVSSATIFCTCLNLFP
jgi:asparagine synthase (glutamine-hydrolysing)